MPTLKFILKITFDSSIEKIDITYGSFTDTYTDSGSDMFISPEPGNDLYMDVTLKAGYSIDTTTLGTVAGNRITIAAANIAANVELNCTITTKAASSKLSVDLTTLSGWANLSEGNHTIKIKAKGTGYKDSELSAGVTVSKGINPNVGGVLSGNLGTNEEFIATNDLTTYSDADKQTLTFISDYETKELPELLTGLGFDLIQRITDEEGNIEIIDLNYWIKLTSTFSIFVVRNKITGVQRLDDNVSAYVISPDVVDKDLNKVKLVQVQPNHITALNTVKHSSSDPQDTITPVTMKCGLSFLITRGNFDKTLGKGTYQFIENPNIPAPIDITQNITATINTLTDNNTYGSQKAIDTIAVYRSSTSEIGSLAIFNEDPYYGISTSGEWTYEDENGSYTATDTTKLRTIIVETDQTVSPEFYKWAITDGNLVKQAEGETWLLNDDPNDLTQSNQDFTSLNFTSNSQSFVRILRQYNNTPIPPVNSLLYYKSDGTYATAVYTNDDGIAFWNGQAYRTITFDTAPTGDLLTWLQANGTKQS